MSMSSLPPSNFPDFLSWLPSSQPVLWTRGRWKMQLQCFPVVIMPHTHIAQVDTIYGYTSSKLFQKFSECHPRPRRLIGQVLQDWLAPKEESWGRKYFLCIEIEQDREKTSPHQKKGAWGKSNSVKILNSFPRAWDSWPTNRIPRRGICRFLSLWQIPRLRIPLPKGPLVINGAVPAIIWGTKFYFRASFKMQFSFWVTFEYSVRGMARWQKAVM